jgi:hypothetical protein
MGVFAYCRHGESEEMQMAAAFPAAKRRLDVTSRTRSRQRGDMLIASARIQVPPL